MKRLRETYYPIKLFLFASRAKGFATEVSDYDFLLPTSDLTEYAIAYRYPDTAKQELTLEIAEVAVNLIQNKILKD